jgi:diacylglycerol kinase family enzyme
VGVACNVFGTLGAAIQFSLFTWALRWLPPSRVVIYLTLNPIVAILLASLFLGETVTPVLIAGLVFVIGVLTMSAIGTKRTCLFALHMSAYDPKRTSIAPSAMELEPAANVIGGMRATLFHNPTAGHKATKDDILAAMKLADFNVRYVSVKDDNFEEAFEKKADLLVVAGGDGTIAEVLTRLPDRAMPVALLPLGTANNIARSLGIAGTPQELVETWKIDNTHPFDVGTVKASWGTSRFLEGFGVGVFAEFLKAADRGEKAKGADNLRKGRALLEKQVKGAKPIELSIKIDGKTFNGEFLGVEVMNVPFTGPGLPLATKAHVADGLLDVVCFDAARRRDFEQWLDAPQDAQAPVTARQGKIIELVWADTANRLDDESYGNRDKKQVAEIACEKDKLKVLIPVKHPSQKAVAK